MKEGQNSSEYIFSITSTLFDNNKDDIHSIGISFSFKPCNSGNYILKYTRVNISLYPSSNESVGSSAEAFWSVFPVPYATGRTPKCAPYF